MTGVERIAAERKRQVEVEGWTAKHDDNYEGPDLAAAGACYALYAVDPGQFDPARIWPWDPEWWKPSENPIRNLEKAGALFAAEIDRRLRPENKDDPTSNTVPQVRTQGPVGGTTSPGGMANEPGSSGRKGGG